jgi:hypothetical protein
VHVGVLLALQVCDVDVLTQLTRLQLVGHSVLEGDLQPLSKLQKLAGVNWQLEGGLVVPQDWTASLRRQARQWSHTVKQAVQQWLAPSWCSLKHLHLDIEMDRATLQAIANHCPQLAYLSCSTLYVKESQPPIQLSSLCGLTFTDNLTRGTCPTPVPVSSYAALNAPLLEMITIADIDEHRLIANVGHFRACCG